MTFTNGYHADQSMAETQANTAQAILPHILVVDDEMHIRDALSQMLMLDDLDATTATDGEDGWQTLQNGHFDLVITDIRMPRLDGLGLLARIQEHLPEMPVIVVTGNGATDTAIAALRGSAVDFITKPFERDAVLGAVRRSLENRRLKKELIGAQKLADIGLLAAGVAHELNNPLNAIMAAAERLQKRMHRHAANGQADIANSGLDHELLEATDRYLHMIIRNSERCSNIVQALRTYARRDDQTKKPCDINTAISECLFLSEHTLRAQGGAQIELNLAPSLPSILCNPQRMVQVFVNLFTNAQDAMPQGGTITVTTRLTDEDKVMVTVADTGSGIPSEIQDHIFDPFFTTKEIGRGTGLGLSIVAGIIRDCKGTIWVESLENRGTVFTVLFPTETSRLVTTGRQE